MKKFYTAVAVEDEKTGGYGITLDGRPVRTPAKAGLVVPTRAMADGIAGEWDGQGETIKPETMPLTQLCNTAIDRLPTHRERIIDDIARYGETDLVCYHAENPDELVAQQQKNWTPLLEWLNHEHGVLLLVQTGVQYLKQRDDAVDALRLAISGRDDFETSALHLAVGACGSVVIGLAMVDGKIDAEQAFKAAYLDEEFQAERWGPDAEAAARAKHIYDDLNAASQFLAHLRAAD